VRQGLGFLLETFTEAPAPAGIHYRAVASDVVLPLGISFYTFETVSYLVDVYRHKFQASPSFVDHTLFLATVKTEHLWPLYSLLCSIALHADLLQRYKFEPSKLWDEQLC
jgi:hypothetical protein